MTIPRVASAALLALAAAACEGTLEVKDILGTYVSTAFTVHAPGQAPVDVVAAGGSLVIELVEGGTTRGQLVIPAVLNGGTAVTLPMVGNFTFGGQSVRFQQFTDSFVRDMTFRATGHTLVGDSVIGGDTIRVFMARQFQ